MKSIGNNWEKVRSFFQPFQQKTGATELVFLDNTLILHFQTADVKKELVIAPLPAKPEFKPEFATLFFHAYMRNRKDLDNTDKKLLLALVKYIQAAEKSDLLSAAEIWYLLNSGNLNDENISAEFSEGHYSIGREKQAVRVELKGKAAHDIVLLPSPDNDGKTTAYLKHEENGQPPDRATRRAIEALKSFMDSRVSSGPIDLNSLESFITEDLAADLQAMQREVAEEANDTSSGYTPIPADDNWPRYRSWQKYIDTANQDARKIDPPPDTAAMGTAVLFFRSPCLNDCLFCGKETTSQVDFESVRDIVSGIERQTSEATYERLFITGYEPATVPNIVEIIEHCRDLGFKDIEFQTSGNTLAFGRFGERLVKSGVTSFNIPIFAPESELHDAIVRTPGAFTDVTDGIRRMRDLGAKLYLFSVVLKQNIQVMDDLNDFAGSLQANSFVFGFPRAKHTGYPDICPRLPEIGEHIHKAYAYGLPLCISYFEGKDPAAYTLHALIEKSHNESKGYVYFIDQRAQYVEGICDRCTMKGRCPGVLRDYVDFFGEEALEEELNPYIK